MWLSFPLPNSTSDLAMNFQLHLKSIRYVTAFPSTNPPLLPRSSYIYPQSSSQSEVPFKICQTLLLLCPTLSEGPIPLPTKANVLPSPEQPAEAAPECSTPLLPGSRGARHTGLPAAS